MKVYFDTEFTGLHKETTLISLGLVDENNRQFYAEFTDFDITQVDSWISKNVLSKLEMLDFILDYRMNDSGGDYYHFNRKVLYDDNSQECGSKTTVVGRSKQIKDELLKWLGTDQIDFISDVAHYDFILLIDLISGNALQMPDNISPVCHDINQDIATYFDISDKDAFDKNREEIANLKCKEDDKHNSLHDALVIKAIYEKIHN